MTQAAETKIRLSLGTIIVAVCMVVTGASGFALVKGMAENNQDDIAEHKVMDRDNWLKVFNDVEDNEEKIHMLELQNTRIEQNQKEILRRIDEYHNDIGRFIKQWEPGE